MESGKNMSGHSLAFQITRLAALLLNFKKTVQPNMKLLSLFSHLHCCKLVELS